MSVLLVGVRGELGRAVAARMISEGDEVRVVEDRPTEEAEWAGLGAHVARGSGADPDLIERAAQGVRTIVVGEDESAPAAEVVAAVLEGARMAARSEIRLVVVTTTSAADVTEAVVSSGLDHVIVRMPTERRFLQRPRSAPRLAFSVETIVRVIDAADDLAGNPREDVDLSDEAAWTRLRLEPPGSLGG